MLVEAYACVVELRGEEVAQALCVENPRAGIEGQPLPWTPEPTGPLENEPARRRKRFWFF